MRSPRRTIAVLVLAVTAVAGVGWSFSWPWRDDGARFCEALRSQQPDPGSLIESLSAFAAAAPPEIRRDAEYVRDFTRGVLAGKFPGASGPGVAILSMNPDLVAAQQRIAAYVQRTCGVPVPFESPTGEASTATGDDLPDRRE